MAAPLPHSSVLNSDSTKYGSALISLTTLFFMWGFLTSFNDILIPHLKSVFSLGYGQVMLVQSSFFIAYFLVSIPAGVLVSRYGYRKGILTGLLLASAGAFLFFPAAEMVSFSMFLLALFVLASGITVLQVSANPYVSILGPPETASSRLNLSQALNSLGHTMGPMVGAFLILGHDVLTAEQIKTLLPEQLQQYKTEQVDLVKLPYIGLAVSLFLLMLVMAKVKLPQTLIQETSNWVSWKNTLRNKGLLLASLAIFLYVGAEVSIGSFLVNFFSQKEIGGLSEKEAGKLVSYYWGAAMAGRFLGSYLMRTFNPRTLLSWASTGSGLLVLATVFGSGEMAMYTILSVGLFNSIMFPTIFTIGIKGLGVLTGQGSSILVMCIVGGGIIPLIQGNMADFWGIQTSFLLPLVCYAYILWFAKRSDTKTDVLAE
ncbi:MAG: L-fucose:H+ symporter permease [Bacteroidia bacterium]|nr:L-fucose:H+ symporter permease [Bacteroidia bacterium]